MPLTNIKLPFLKFSDAETDAIDDAVEAYADGITVCTACGVSARKEEFESCAWGGCPMFGET